MSKTVWDADGLVITTYTGPLRPDVEPRKRIQIAGWDHDKQRRTWATLGMGQWASLRRAIEALGPDCDGPEI